MVLARRRGIAHGVEQIVQNLKAEPGVRAEDPQRLQAVAVETGNPGPGFQAQHEQGAGLLLLELLEGIGVRDPGEVSQVPLLARAEPFETDGARQRGDQVGLRACLEVRAAADHAERVGNHRDGSQDGDVLAVHQMVGALAAARLRVVHAGKIVVDERSKPLAAVQQAVAYGLAESRCGSDACGRDLRKPPLDAATNRCKSLRIIWGIRSWLTQTVMTS